VSVSLLKDLFIYFREREQEGQRERERVFQADPVVSGEPDMGPDLTTPRSQTERKSKSQMLNQMGHPGIPGMSLLLSTPLPSDQDPTLLTTFNLNHLPRGPVSK